MLSAVKDHRTHLQRSSSLRIRHLLLLCLLSLTACATVPRERFYDDVIIIRTEAGDSFSSLAAKYLNDSGKGWQISEFNNIASLSPGKELIIPLQPFTWGGLKTDGYQTVPVLAYFRFSKKRVDTSIVAEKAFKRQMNFLKEHGYRVISLDQLLNFLEFKQQIPEKSVVLTFDDGWQSFYDIAFPILKDYGFPATLFVRTDFIGEKAAMSWNQLNELAKSGVDIQCKISTHRSRHVLKDSQAVRTYFSDVQEELSQSKRIIKKKMNKECRYLALPSAKPNSLVIGLLKKEGYCAAVTLERGSNPFFIPHYSINRSVINGEFDMDQFKKNLFVFSKSELK